MSDHPVAKTASRRRLCCGLTSRARHTPRVRRSMYKRWDTKPGAPRLGCRVYASAETAISPGEDDLLQSDDEPLPRQNVASVEKRKRLKAYVNGDNMIYLERRVMQPLPPLERRIATAQRLDTSTRTGVEHSPT
ncbi:hypothetical protein VTI28DRAFT_8879 [Corynascus sepedonium]